MSINETDAQETLAAWRAFEATGDVMPLLRQSIKGERERNEARRQYDRLRNAAIQFSERLDKDSMAEMLWIVHAGAGNRVEKG